MSLAALERLEARYAAMIAALDRNDIDEIAAAGAALDSARHELGEQPSSPEAKSCAERIARLAETASIRINILADQARRRAAALALARGEGAALTYSR